MKTKENNKLAEMLSEAYRAGFEAGVSWSEFNQGFQPSGCRELDLQEPERTGSNGSVQTESGTNGTIQLLLHVLEDLGGKECICPYGTATKCKQTRELLSQL